MNLINLLEIGAYTAAIGIMVILLVFTIIMIAQIKKELKKNSRITTNHRRKQKYE